MNTIQDFTKGKTITAKDGRELVILTKAPQDLGYYLTTPADPTFMVMVRVFGRAFDLMFNQADLDRGAYVIKD